jgi:tRNA threonylcarbamoyladenosine biosynthesis protein TsaB
MLVLAFETSTAVGSVALLREGKIIGEEVSRDPKKHTEFVISASDKLLKKNNLSPNDITLFATGKGPGSFTGIRISINAVRTYAKLLDKRVFTAHSFEILHDEMEKDSICMINAYKNMVYWAVFKGETCIDGPTAIFVNQIEAQLARLNIVEPILCLGDGYSAYQNVFSPKLARQLIRDNSIPDYPKADVLANLAYKNPHQTIDWKSTIPLYIRASEAEENLRTK